MQHETLELKPRRYAPVLHVGENKKIFLPAESYAIGNVIRTDPKVLYAQLKDWQAFRSELRENSQFDPFELRDHYRIKVRERAPKGKWKTRKRDLLGLTGPELRFALLQKMMTRFGSANTWNVGSDVAIGQQKDKKPYTGTVVLTGEVRSKDNARKSDVLKYWSVNIIEPYIKDGEIRLRGLYCTCKDFRWMHTKEGPVDVEGACSHIAALQDYAHEFPHLVRNYLNVDEGLEFFLPFNFREEDMANLKFDVLIDYLFNNSPYFTIGKKLLKNPDIYNIPDLIRALEDSIITFEVLTQEKVKREIDRDKLNDMKKMSEEMGTRLGQRGYKLKGNCLEFKDTEYETVCMNYEKGDNIVRVLFNKNFPPAFVHRKKIPGETVKPFQTDGDPGHPYKLLFQPQKRLDDRTRKKTEFEVRLPVDIEIPRSLREDYREAIGENYEGGINGLATLLEKIGADKLINFLRG